MHLAGLVGSYPAMTAQLLRARPPSGYGWPVSPARSWLPRPTVAATGTWREQQRQVIEEGLDQIGARLAADLTAELGVLRESAVELLDLDLTVPEPGRWLAVDRRFFFTTAMTAALRAAQELRVSSASEAERREEELASRERELRGIAAALDQAEGSAPSGSPSHRPYW
jgi:hypothetical protein